MNRSALPVLALVLAALPAAAQVTVAVDPTADVHAISPLIYGLNFPSDAQIDAARVPLARWGGNRTTRYNYLVDTDNSANDYYFENIAGCWDATGNYCNPPPSDPKEQSQANAFLQRMRQKGVTAFLTVPTMGWVAKSAPYAQPLPCSFPRGLNANQDKYDPYNTNCGNGLVGGVPIAPQDVTLINTAIAPAWNQDWASYLVTKFGPSNGRRIYQLDNEPNLWNSTHRDAHPAATTYDELWQKMRDNAVALLAADPTAEISGPGEWGWPNYFCSAADDVSKGCFTSSPDRSKHGGTDLTSWLLQQARAYEQTNGKRILHWLDLHYYPQAGSPPETTRSLWDPAYPDPTSWIATPIRLIPRMRDWVNANYPGTKIAIGEYDFYHHDEALGAVTYAMLLGIFGREGLDAATAWSPPGENEVAFAAYKLYRNYDGAGGQFESTSVRATVSGSSTLNAYAATGSSRMTVVLVNTGASSVTPGVTFGSFPAQTTARWYALGTGSAIVRKPDLAVSNGRVSVTLPAMSIGMLVVDQQGTSTADGGTPGTDAGTGTPGTDAGTGTPGTDAGTGMPGNDGGAGTDAGTSGPDAGTDSGPDAGVTGPKDAVEGEGCGCGSGSGGASVILTFLVGFALRRRSVRAPQ